LISSSTSIWSLYLLIALNLLVRNSSMSILLTTTSLVSLFLLIILNNLFLIIVHILIWICSKPLSCFLIWNVWILKSCSQQIMMELVLIDLTSIWTLSLYILKLITSRNLLIAIYNILSILNMVYTPLVLVCILAKIILSLSYCIRW
jgi:hypothetical protein